ncbi:MAG: hypothetical protein ACQES4_09825 [Bacillota bacterium]
MRGKGDKERVVPLTETTIRLSQPPLSSLGAEAITAEASLALFIFEQGSNQAHRNNNMMQCLKSLATGQVISKRVFNPRSKGK